MPAYLSLLARARSAAIAAIACSIGCVMESPDESTVAAATTTADGCEGLGCGTNSPVIAGTPFWEVNRDKLIQNAQKFRLVDFRSAAGTPYQIDVRQARVVGLDKFNNIALDTPGIKNAKITLIDDRDGKLWELTIIETDNITYWAPPLGAVTTTYRVLVHPPPGAPGQADTDLCSRPPADPEWPGKPRHMIFHEGDRYDPLQRIVTSTGPATAGWFNISCAGSVPFKLHLQRHTEPGTNPLHPTTRLQRQALMRAYASVVCWGGPSFTVQGERLDLADSQGVMSFNPLLTWASMSKIEGLWDDTHAICRGEHRLVHHDPLPPLSAISQAEADRIWQAIPIRCPQAKSCSDFAIEHPGFPANWKQLGLVLTMNP